MNSDGMAEIRASFFIECEELLEALQDSLQLMEDGQDDEETINIVFRAVHSIKGGAGAFGLEGLVRFAHRYETALDEVRAGRLEVGPQALKLFFQAADHLSDLVRICRDEEPLPDATSADLLAQLNELLGDMAPEEEDEAEEDIAFQPMILSLDLDPEEEGGAEAEQAFDLDALPPPPQLSDAASTNVFRILFTPLAELFDTGNEPALLLRNLAELGSATATCRADDLPSLDKLTPEIPHLTWEVTLETSVDQAEVASIFEFVEGLCKLEILEAPTPDGPSTPPDPDTSADPDPTPEPSPPVAAKMPPAQPPPAPAADAADRPAAPEPPAKREPAAKAAPAGGGAAPKSIVRVDLERIERLVNLVGELVINQAMLGQSLEQAGLSPHSDAMHGLEEFQRLTRDIQDSVMMIRAQPVKSLFQRMSRIVRESSAAVQKDVRLITIGEGTEVDKTVIERLADPLTHMIRNAVDHGLESPEDRLASGKDRQGRITLSAAHRSGRVVIDIADDGAGINRPRVRQIAVDKGLIPADAVLSDTDIDNLLFLPGFSTAAVVSDLSGRGVGMDVVRTAIQALGGRITINSEPGKGTTFSISLPLTLAVLDGMVIEVADETMVLPLNLVVETLSLTNDCIQMVRPGHHVVEVRNGFVPLFDLAAALGYRPPLTEFEGHVVLLIASEDGQPSTALVIDDIIDQRQVVIKGLDDSFHRAPGIAAATILGDGQIALILDPSDIIHNIGLTRPAKTPPQLEGMHA